MLIKNILVHQNTREMSFTSWFDLYLCKILIKNLAEYVTVPMDIKTSK